MRIKKLSIRITLFIVLATTIGILILSLLSSYNMQKIMENEAKVELESIVNQITVRLDLYMEKEYVYLDGFMEAKEMLDLVEDSTNPDTVGMAQVHTEKYMDAIPNCKSLLFAEYEGTVITHNLHEMIGYRNSEEIIEKIKNLYYNDSATPVYSSVTAVSPATNEVSLIFSKSLYKANGTPSGYCAEEIDTSEFYNLLTEGINVTANQEIILTGVNNPTVYFSTNADEIAQSTENEAVLSAMNKITSEGKESGNISYTQAGTGKEMYGYYRYLPERDWLLFVGADIGQLYAQAHNASLQLFGLGAVVIIVIAIVLVLIIGYLIRPITKIQEALTRVAALDLSENKTIDSFEKRADEIGKLAKDTRSVIYNLKGAMGVFKEYSNMLDENSGNLDKASKQLTAITSENKDIADGLSLKINETNEAIETIHAEIENIVSLVDEVSEKVQVGQEDSEKLIQSAEEINGKINTEIESNMATLQETMANMQVALESLNAVEQINALAEDIMSITSQTNLLSLNASIEAARAGEAGRGFAVVAGEIGQLADQSKETAMNITEIVAASNKSVADVRDQVTKLIDFIKNDVIASFEVFSAQSQHYDEGITEIKQAVVDIGTVMDNLSKSVDEIANQISSVNDASLENTDGVSSILGMNSETNDISDNIELLAKNNRDNADDLRAAINQFNVD